MNPVLNLSEPKLDLLSAVNPTLRPPVTRPAHQRANQASGPGASRSKGPVLVDNPRLHVAKLNDVVGRCDRIVPRA
jgi:hypothetical protein